jgi:hypothetical protein
MGFVDCGTVPVVYAFWFFLKSGWADRLQVGEVVSTIPSELYLVL